MCPSSSSLPSTHSVLFSAIVIKSQEQLILTCYGHHWPTATSLFGDSTQSELWYFLDSIGLLKCELFFVLISAYVSHSFLIFDPACRSRPLKSERTSSSFKYSLVLLLLHALHYRPPSLVPKCIRPILLFQRQAFSPTWQKDACFTKRGLGEVDRVKLEDQRDGSVARRSLESGTSHIVRDSFTSCTIANSLGVRSSICTADRLYASRVIMFNPSSLFFLPPPKIK